MWQIAADGDLGTHGGGRRGLHRWPLVGSLGWSAAGRAAGRGWTASWPDAQSCGEHREMGNGSYSLEIYISWNIWVSYSQLIIRWFLRFFNPPFGESTEATMFCGHVQSQLVKPLVGDGTDGWQQPGLHESVSSSCMSAHFCFEVRIGYWIIESYWISLFDSSNFAFMFLLCHL